MAYISVPLVFVLRITKDIESLILSPASNFENFGFKTNFSFLWPVDRESFDKFRLLCLRHSSIDLFKLSPAHRANHLASETPHLAKGSIRRPVPT